MPNRAVHRLVPALALVLGLAPVAGPAFAQGGDVFLDLGRGPVEVHVPESYDPEVPTPLVLLLHGYGANGDIQELYMRFTPVSDELGFLYAHPDGTEDFLGSQFWNATDYCCDFLGTGVDDSAYLLELIDAIAARANVDPNRVYLVGHSNGGFMSYRMACDHSDRIAAIASLAGATWSDPADCAPEGPVHVLQIHGELDESILFDGDCTFFACYPGAIESAAQWAGFAGCDPVLDTSPPDLDLDFLLPGAETKVVRVESGCDPNGSAELWYMEGAGHIPFLNDQFAREVVGFFYDHPKQRTPGSESRAAGR